MELAKVMSKGQVRIAVSIRKRLNLKEGHRVIFLEKDGSIDQLKQAVDRKFEGKAEVLDLLLTALPYELVYTPRMMSIEGSSIRDPADYPVLYSAVTEGVGVHIARDMDSADVGIEKPEIMTPAQFVEKYRF